MANVVFRVCEWCRHTEQDVEFPPIGYACESCAGRIVRMDEDVAHMLELLLRQIQTKVERPFGSVEGT